MKTTAYALTRRNARTGEIWIDTDVVGTTQADVIVQASADEQLMGPSWTHTNPRYSVVEVTVQTKRTVMTL